MILESIVTTVDAKGQLNLAPMGPRIEGDPRLSDLADMSIILRPFQSSRTCGNLLQTRKAVIHVTDDVELIARAAVDDVTSEEITRRVQRLDDSDWWVLQDCHRWFAVEVDSITDADQPRVDMQCRVKRSEVVRPFFGINRAKHAVVEAAILATRTHLLDPQQIVQDLERLQPLIEKTGGSAEHRAFEFLRQTIDQRLAGHLADAAKHDV